MLLTQFSTYRSKILRLQPIATHVIQIIFVENLLDTAWLFVSYENIEIMSREDDLSIPGLFVIEILRFSPVLIFQTKLLKLIYIKGNSCC